MYHVHITTFFQSSSCFHTFAFLSKEIRFFFFFFAPKNCFQTLLTNPISDLEMFFKNAVVDKFWFLGKIVLTEIVRCSWTNLEKCLQDFFCQLFFSLPLFCFVLSRFCWFFTFPRHRKKNFCGAHRRPETKTETETEAANYWNQNLLLCPQQKNQRREGGGEGREKSACECVCVWQRACVG